MSAATTPARRLLAILEEEGALETRPLEEVLADLEAHGVDPAGPTRLARRLAEHGAGPAAALLGAVLEDEAAEAEIAALESADLESVRDQLEVGTVATVAAEAQRRAGAQSNVVGLRRRRNRAWAWAGSLVGMAACALIVVGVWWPPAEKLAPAPEFAVVEVAPPMADSAMGADAAPPQAAASGLNRLASPSVETDNAADEAGPATPPQPVPAPLASPSPAEIAGSEVPRQSIPEMRIERLEALPEAGDGSGPAVGGTLAERSDAGAQGAQEVLLSPPPGRSAGVRVETVPVPEDVASAPAVAPPVSAEEIAPPPPRRPERRAQADAGSDDAPDGAQTEVLAEAREAEGAEAASAMPQALMDAAEPASDFRSGAAERGLAVVPSTDLSSLAAGLPRVVELLPIDLRIAPSMGLLTSVESRRERGLTSGDEGLTRRLDDMRDVAAGRHIVALATVEEAGQTYDTVIVLRDPAAEPPTGQPDILLTLLFGERAEVFEQIRLPPRPDGPSE